MQLVYGVNARAERQQRRAAAARLAPAPATVAGRPPSGLPVVAVQCESFFDARRLHTCISDDLLPAFDHCCRSGVQYGRLAVPCWGANTTRAEFVALTGVEQAALGFDRFNSYHAFAHGACAVPDSVRSASTRSTAVSLVATGSWHISASTPSSARKSSPVLHGPASTWRTPRSRA